VLPYDFTAWKAVPRIFNGLLMRVIFVELGRTAKGVSIAYSTRGWIRSMLPHELARFPWLALEKRLSAWEKGSE
jgi:hypothetical protein